jgi:hypothetical protein
MRGKTTRDWHADQRRYLVRFSDGGSGMRFFDEPLEVGSVVERDYRIERIEEPPSPGGLGHAWATLIE